MTLACEDVNLKLFELVTIADVDDKKRVDYSWVQIWKLKFGQDFEVLVKMMMFGWDFEVDAWLRL